MKNNTIATIEATLAKNKFKALQEWIYSKATQELSHETIELEIETKGRELLRLLLQSHITARGNGNVGEAIAISHKSSQPTYYTYKKQIGRKLITTFGKVHISRIGYYIPGESFIFPLDEILQLPRRIYSYVLQKRLLKMAVQMPFDEALDTIHELNGVKIPKRSAENMVIDISVDFDNFYQLRKTNENDTSGPILVGSIDCKGIPMIKRDLPPPTSKSCARRKKGQKAQKKRMSTVAVVYTQEPYYRSPEAVVKSLFDKKKRKKTKKKHRPENKRVWASLKAGKDVFVKDVWKEMQRRDIENKKSIVVIMDGERALLLRVKEIMKNYNITLVLDFIHVLEKLWELGNSLYGEATIETELFVRQRALKILQGKVGQVVKGLRLTATKRHLKGITLKKVKEVTEYYYKNRTRMCYHRYLTKGLPIASGTVEGACKNLIKDRMERSGMKWSSDMAEAMVKMRATYLSGDFNEYWNYHVEQEQNRLHPKDSWKTV